MTKVSAILDGLPPVTAYDFAEFGEYEVQPLSKFQSIGGKMLSRNWVTIPHVTHHDNIDITDIEVRRKNWNEENPDLAITLLAPMMIAMVATLKENPKFNASLLPDGESIALKKYFNIGVAVDTPNGLLVPVIRDCDKKSHSELAQEISHIAQKAAGKGLTLDEMSGSSITISSLGHIGGTGFSPIVNAPDVAILGVTRARKVPVLGSNDELEWRTHLPLSLSYDHRVINGVDAAKFIITFGENLSQLELT